MKISAFFMFALVVVTHGVTSCCSVPPAICFPCSDSSYRPLGRPATPGEAYTAGYLCGLRDRRNEVGSCWDRHRNEVGVGLQEFGERGYTDGYAGRVQTDCSIPDQQRATKLYR